MPYANPNSPRAIATRRANSKRQNAKVSPERRGAAWRTYIKKKGGRTWSNWRMRKWTRENPRKSLVAHARQRAKQKHLDFDLTVDGLLWPSRCPITGRKFGPQSSFDGMSLDRRNNRNGYTVANTRVISRRANAWKGNMSLKEARRLVAYMEGRA